MRCTVTSIVGAAAEGAEGARRATAGTLADADFAAAAGRTLIELTMLGVLEMRKKPMPVRRA